MEKEQFTNHNLIAMMRWDCQRQADAAEIRLSRVIDCLSDDNHLGALDAFRALDEDKARLSVFLMRMAKLS